MKTETEELLLMLEWSIEGLMFPSLSSLTESYEGWLYRTGRLRLRRLERQGLVERVEKNGKLWLRLTTLGRMRALGGRDPVARWNRKWDGRWRLFIFDLPVAESAVRQRLLRWLKQHSFGYLQDSVWIHPDPVDEIADAMEKFSENVEAFTLMEARHVGGHNPLTLVKGAWNFEKLKQRYEVHLTFLKTMPDAIAKDAAHLSSWLQREREHWREAAAFDPFLPRELWLAGYLGEKVWKLRAEKLRTATAVLVHKNNTRVSLT